MQVLLHAKDSWAGRHHLPSKHSEDLCMQEQQHNIQGGSPNGQLDMPVDGAPLGGNADVAPAAQASVHDRMSMDK